jgi:hypothetical protein
MTDAVVRGLRDILDRREIASRNPDNRRHQLEARSVRRRDPAQVWQRMQI